MNARKVVYLFFSTLLIGALSGAVVGIVIDPSTYFSGGFLNFLFGLIWILGISAAISLVAQMGYFAYLTLHRFALSLFKTTKLWNRVQIVLIAFVFFDLVYFRYTAFAEGTKTILDYMIMPIIFLALAGAVAYRKKIETNSQAFVPAFFFMFVVTTIEWLPALTVGTVNESKWLWIYITPLFVSNAWQLLLLHRLTKNSGPSLKKKPL